MSWTLVDHDSIMFVFIIVLIPAWLPEYSWQSFLQIMMITITWNDYSYKLLKLRHLFLLPRVILNFEATYVTVKGYLFAA